MRDNVHLSNEITPSLPVYTRLSDGAFLPVNNSLISDCLNDQYVIMKKMLRYFSLTIICAAIYLTCYAQAPGWAWATRSGTIFTDQPLHVGSDAAGNVYAVSRYGANPTFGNSTVPFNDSGLILSKYSPSGNLLNNVVLNINTPIVENVLTDRDGNTIIVGHVYGGSVEQIPFPAQAGGQPYIAKYNNQGSFEWLRFGIGINATDTRYSSEYYVDGTGNIYIQADFVGSIVFDQDTLRAPAPTAANVRTASFVVKYSPKGDMLWARKVTSPKGVESYGLVADSKGNVYKTGVYFDTLALDSQHRLSPLSPASNLSSSIVKYDNNGNVVWSQNYNATLSFTLFTDIADNLYIHGIWDTLNYNGIDTNNIYSNLMKLDTGGRLIWAKRIFYYPIIAERRISMDANSNFYVNREFSGNITIGQTTLYASRQSSWRNSECIIKYDTSANPVWALATDSGSNLTIQSLNVNSQGEVYVLGNFFPRASRGTGIVFFGSNMLTANTRAADVFLAKLSYALSVSNGPQADDEVRLYPNPSSGEISVVPGNGSKYTRAQVYDQLGKEVYSQALNGKSQMKMDLSFLPNGIYYARFSKSDGSLIKKIILQR